MRAIFSGTGAYRTSEKHVAVLPRIYKLDGTRRGVLGVTGANSDADAYFTDPVVTNALTDRGTPVMFGDFGASTTTFGNPDSVTAIGAGWTWAKSTLGFKTDKVMLVGGSMGGMECLNWARANLSTVQAIALIIPLVDGEDLRANNRGGFQTAFETAWTNNATWQTARPTSNPVEYADELAAIPIHIWYSTNDTVVPEATQQAFATAHGNTTLTSLGAQGHTASGLDEASVADWLLAA